MRDAATLAVVLLALVSVRISPTNAPAEGLRLAPPAFAQTLEPVRESGTADLASLGAIDTTPCELPVQPVAFPRTIKILQVLTDELVTRASGEGERQEIVILLGDSEEPERIQAGAVQPRGAVRSAPTSRPLPSSAMLAAHSCT